MVPIFSASFNFQRISFPKESVSSFGRRMILPCASPPDAAAARDEVIRVAKLGFKEANFLVNDVSLEMNLKPWDIFWDAAEDAGIVVSYHVGGSVQKDSVRATTLSLPA